MDNQAEVGSRSGVVEQSQSYSCGVPGCKSVHRSLDEAEQHRTLHAQILNEG